MRSTLACAGRTGDADQLLGSARVARRATWAGVRAAARASAPPGTPFPPLLRLPSQQKLWAIHSQFSSGPTNSQTQTLIKIALGSAEYLVSLCHQSNIPCSGNMWRTARLFRLVCSPTCLPAQQGRFTSCTCIRPAACRGAHPMLSNPRKLDTNRPWTDEIMRLFIRDAFPDSSGGSIYIYLLT